MLLDSNILIYAANEADPTKPVLYTRNSNDSKWIAGLDLVNPFDN